MSSGGRNRGGGHSGLCYLLSVNIPIFELELELYGFYCVVTYVQRTLEHPKFQHSSFLSWSNMQVQLVRKISEHLKK